MTEHAIMSAAFTGCRDLTLATLLQAVERGLPDHFVRDGDVEDGLSRLRVDRTGKIDMVFPARAYASDFRAFDGDDLFRLTFKARLGAMEIMPEVLYFTRNGSSQVQLRFPSRVYDRIDGAAGGPFDASLKAHMLSMICRLASAIQADGFALTLVDEDQVLPSPDLSSILEFVGNRQRWLSEPTRFMLAGCRATLLQEPCTMDEEDPPFFYACAQFAVFDSFWPPPRPRL